jgi:hypothetical protein
MRDIPVSKRVIDIKRKHNIRRLRSFIFFTLLLFVTIGGSAYFSFHKNITIDKVLVTGVSIIDPIDISTEVKQQLEGRYLYIYNKSNSFIYPEKKIYDDLILHFPRIKELTINRDGLNILNIDIKERMGSYLYCGSQIPELKSEIGENCYFVNNDGYIFDKAPYFSGNVYFKFYIKIIDEANPLSQNILDQNEFHKIIRFIDGITLLGFNPVLLLANEDNTYTIYLDHHIGATSPVILFKYNDDLENILNNLVTAMDKQEFKEEINSKYDSLLYIDLRFKSKVLYKFQ